MRGKRREKSNTIDEQQQGSVEEVILDVVDVNQGEVPQVTGN